MIYQKSKNYELLYDLVMQGLEIPCWVYEQSKKIITVVRVANLIKTSKDVYILCGYLGGEGFITMDRKNKELFIKQCQDYALEWLLPVNAEFCNSKGELEYEIGLIPNITKHSVEYCPILIDFTLSNRQFYYVPFGDIEKMISVSYHNYGKFLEHLSVIKTYTTEQALAAGLEMVKKLKAG